jgi:hypothetical protein
MFVARRVFLVSALLGLIMTTVATQDSTLSDDAVQKAIDAGRAKPKTWPVVTLQQVSRGPNAAVFTPLGWIQREAAERKRDGRNMQLKDVTADMRAPIVRVMAYPDQPVGTLTASQIKTATSVIGVSLVDKARTQTLESIGTEPFDVPFATPNHARVVLKGMWARFDLQSFLALRKDDQEFFVVLHLSDKRDMTFAVEPKQFSNLP